MHGLSGKRRQQSAKVGAEGAALAIGRQIDVADIEVGVVIATVAIEERLARIEATLPHLASKAVLKSLEVRIYGVMVAVVSAGVAFLKLTGT